MQTRPFRRLLILDDDHSSLVLARLIIENMNIAERVVTFLSVDEGLSFIEQYCINEEAGSEECPDLILLDLSMPGKDGYEFLEAFEKLIQRHLLRARVVILTASEYDEGKAKIALYPVYAFMNKPVTEEKISHLMAGSAGQGEG